MFDNKRATATQFDNKRLTIPQFEMLSFLHNYGPALQVAFRRNVLNGLIRREYVLKVNGVVSITEAGEKVYTEAIKAPEK